MNVAEAAIAGLFGGNGGSGGSGMTRTTLYFNNWSTSVADIITLTDSYKNYDVLEITIMRISDNNTRLSPSVVTVPCDAIEAATEMPGVTPSIVLSGYSQEYIGYTITGETTLTKFGVYGNLTVVGKIVGVKYAG